jgi:hypothetical protein
MSDPGPDLGVEWWAKKLDDIDHEIAALATVCDVHILSPGVIERVLHNDDSVCGSANGPAFAKLRSLLMMHYMVREKAVDALGPEETERVVNAIVDRLRERIGARPRRHDGTEPAL